MVVRCFEIRGAPIPTRLEGMVVRTVVSCLGGNSYVGMVVRGRGSRGWLKRGLFDRNGRD